VIAGIRATPTLVGRGLVCVLALLLPVVAAAQTGTTPAIVPARPTPHAGSWEVSGGLSWQGGFDLGSANAELTRNSSTGTGPFDLFSSASTLGSGFGLQGHVGAFVSNRLLIEGGVRIVRPKLKIDLSGDAESAPDVTAEETLTQYVIDGSALWHFGNVQTGMVVPFAGGGAGYIRDLHEDNQLMETGIEYHALAGAKIWFSDRPRRLGLRGEVGFSIRDGGFGTSDDEDGNASTLPKHRTVPFAGVSMVFLF
jgi:hypothetical protein